jgi:hypothetical protein
MEVAGNALALGDFRQMPNLFLRAAQAVLEASPLRLMD